MQRKPKEYTISIMNNKSFKYMGCIFNRKLALKMMEEFKKEFPNYEVSLIENNFKLIKIIK